jgi:hypothetical protein
MKYAVEMGSGTMKYIPGFIKIGSDIQKLMGIQRQTAWWLHKPPLIYQNKGSGLINGLWSYGWMWGCG